MVLVLVMLTFARSLFEKLTGLCSSLDEVLGWLGWLGWQKPTSGLRSCRLLKVDLIKAVKISEHSKEREVNKIENFSISSGRFR